MTTAGRTWRKYVALLEAIMAHSSLMGCSEDAFLVTTEPDPRERELLHSFREALRDKDAAALAVLERLDISRGQFQFHLFYLAEWSAARRNLLAAGGNYQLLESYNAEEKLNKEAFARRLKGLVLKGTRAQQERAMAEQLHRYLPQPTGLGWLQPMDNPGKPVREYTPAEVVWIYHSNELQREDDLHPSVARSLIRRYLPGGGVVVDPMAGSGTIARMAALMGNVVWASDSQPRESYIAPFDIYDSSLDDKLTEEEGVSANLIFLHPPTPQERGLELPDYFEWLDQILTNVWPVLGYQGYLILIIHVAEQMELLAGAEQTLIRSANEMFAGDILPAGQVKRLTAQHLAASRDGHQGWHILVLQRPALLSDSLSQTALERLTISGVHDLPDFEDVNFIVSIGDPHDEVPEEVNRAAAYQMRLEFHDVIGKPDADDILLNIEQLKRLGHELEHMKPQRVHVHCFAGISRSTAVACYVLGYLKPQLSDEEIVEAILATRPEAQPNKWVLRTVDELLGRKLSRTWNRKSRY